MDQARLADDVFDLVRLQRADEVPAHVGEQPVLAEELLRAVLAEVAHARRDGVADVLDAHGLGDRDDRDVVRLAPDAVRGVGDLARDRLVSRLRPAVTRLLGSARRA